MTEELMKKHAVCFIKKILRKCKRLVSWIISLPISLFLILLFPIYKIKFISLISDRIGHYALNTELLLCYLKEIEAKNKRTKYLFYMREAPICNAQLHSMWKRVITVYPFTTMALQIDLICTKILKNHYKSKKIQILERSDGLQDIDARIKSSKKTLVFNEIENQAGKALLSQLGVPCGKKWICLLVRDPTYLAEYLPGIDWSHHFYRDCDIQKFEKAALFLANNGYYVIRMGKKVAKPFNIQHPKIIDYAMHPLRSDFGDIYLSAHCQFFISTASGLDAVAQIFRRPLLQVNVAPFKSQLQYWYPCEIFITKKVFDNKQKQFIALKKIESIVKDSTNLKNEFDKLGWSVVENNEEEILEAVIEMEESFSEKTFNINKNPFHCFLNSNLSLSMIADREWIRAHPEKFHVRMGSQFLKKNQFMFFE